MVAVKVDYKRIGARIKDARKSKGMTQENLAESLEVSVGYVSQVERGVTKISLDLLGAISTVLEKDLSYFVCETGTDSPNYMGGELTEELKLLSEENRRIVDAVIKAMLEEQK